MTGSQLFLLLAGVMLAPHLSAINATINAVVYLVMACLFWYVERPCKSS